MVFCGLLCYNVAAYSSGRRKTVERVGARELKDRLSHYLQTVRQGKTVVVTMRGKPVARLVPIATSREKSLPPEIEDRLWELVSQGVLAWNGVSFQLPDPVTESHSVKLLSDLIVEDRE